MANGNLAESTRIGIDGEWGFEDFELFFRRYDEVYTFLNISRHLLAKDTDAEGREFSSYFALTQFPWRGGWSAYQSYRALHRTTLPDERPTVVAMRYASPGFIEIGGALISIALVQKIVQSYLLHGDELRYFYRTAHRDFSRRGWLTEDSRLERFRPSPEDLKAAKLVVKTLITLLGLEAVGDWDFLIEDPITGGKVLFAFYRRVKELVEFQISRDSHVDFNPPKDSTDRR